MRIGIDTGGTFTDVVVVDEVTGEVFATKTPSTPEDPSLAVLQGLRKVLRLAGASTDAVAAVSHGTTVATNALLEERFEGLGLVTTEQNEASDTVTAGNVIRTEPPAGTEVDQGTTVLLVVSSGATRAASRRRAGAARRSRPGRRPRTRSRRRGARRTTRRGAAAS